MSLLYTQANNGISGRTSEDKNIVLIGMLFNY